MTRSRRWSQPDPELFAVPELPNPLETPETGTPEPKIQEAAQAQHGASGRSRDETVAADVDDRGVLLSLRIPHHLLRSAHPQHICRAVVEAVADARHQAGTRARERAAARVDLAGSRRTRPRR